MADQKPEETFKVIDRRPFTSEGELRKEAIAEEKKEQEAAAAARKLAGAPSAPKTGSAPQHAIATAETPQPSRSFQMLVDFLGRNAAVLLGGYADPSTGQAILDLEGARELIDMLDALHEKTRGNLAPEDDRLLLDVVGSLKMSFLEISKAAAQAVQEKSKSKT